MSDHADFKNATWIQNGDGSLYCAAHKNDENCKIVPTNYDYHLNLAANVAFGIIFLLSLIAFAVTYFLKKRAGVFTIALVLGLFCEVIGYIGRILSWDNPWDGTGFIMQICCLTIGPAFMAASLYLCLRRVVRAYGTEFSRIPPAYYTRIFIPCDVLALILQATGGGLASVASQNNEDPQTGTNIMIVGLVVQVVTIVGFITAASDFGLRVKRQTKSRGQGALNPDPAMAALRNRGSFKLFLVTIALASVLIGVRSIFRVAELCNGWHGKIIGNQPLFIAFEGTLIALAMVLLNIVHPAFFAKEIFPAKTGGLFKKKQINDHVQMKNYNYASESDEGVRTPQYGYA